MERFILFAFVLTKLIIHLSAETRKYNKKRRHTREREKINYAIIS